MKFTKQLQINLLLVLICLTGLESRAQTTTILSYGFETADATWTYDQTTGVTLARANNNANTGSWSAFYDGANGAGSRINGSVITPSLTFLPGYTYTITVFAKTNASGIVTGQNPTFKIARATTATNAAMSSASGAELLLNTTLTSTSYGSAFSTTFSVTSNTTRFIGFHASASFNNVDAWIDDILITRTCNISSNAGPDQISAATCGLTQVTLAGNTLPAGATGVWSVVSGTGGSFGNTASPTSTFSGTSGNAYTLQWTVSLGTCTNVTDQVDVRFNKAPVIGACPGNIVQCGNNVATWTNPTATGTPNPTVSCSPASGSTFSVGTTSVTCTASNLCGTSSCSFSVTINTNATITCPGDIVTCNPVVTFAPTSGGSPAPSVSCTPASGSTFAVGTTQVNCSATNSCNTSTCSFNVTVNEAPVIGACPSNIVQCDNNVATWSTPSATGLPAPSVSCSPASGSMFNVGTTSVTCTANNSCGSSSCSFSVTINTSATISCPSDIVTCNPVVTFAPASGGSPAPTVSCTPASGSTFAVGTTQVNCSASNSCATNTCSFNVTVNEAPVIGACPSNIVQCDNNVATWSTPSATGSPAPSVSCSPASGSTFNVGTTSVTCTATNSCGSFSCSFSVTINTSATISCPSDIVTCNPVVTFAPTSGGSPAPSVSCTPASGSTFTVGTTQVNCSATNSCNTITCSFNVTVNEAPVIGACPSDISQCDNTIATWTNPTASGLPVPSITCVPASGSIFANGNTVVTCTATNSCGSSSCSFNVTIGSSPTVEAGANQTICYTGTATMNGSIGGGATSAAWSSSGDGSFDNVNNLNAVYTPGPNDITNGTATLTLTTDFQGACTAATDQLTLTIIYTPTPPPGAVTGSTPACPGNTITFSISPVAGATSYIWNSIDATTTVVAGQGTTSADILFGNLPTGQSTYPLSVVAVNQCGNSVPRTFAPRGKISQPNFSNVSPSVICQNTNGVTFSVAPVSGASSYTWSITGTGATIVGPANGTSVSVDFGNFTSVTINVTASNACMTTLARTKTITSTPATPGTVTGQSYPCPGGTYVYSVSPVTGASTYNWNGPAGSIVTGNSNSVSITFGAAVPGGSNVSVSATGGCSNTSTLRLKGVASGIPNIPSTISGPANGQCGELGVSYSAVPNSNQPVATSYTWSVNNGATIAGPNNFSAVSVDFPATFTNVNVSVIANNGCGSSVPRNLLVNAFPSAPVSISGNAAPCAGNVETYCATGSVGATSFIWTIPPSWTVLNTSPPCITVLIGATGGAVTCRGTNACGQSSAKTKPVSISCRQGQVMQGEEISPIQLYPNPAQDKATVKFSSTQSADYTLSLIESTGKVVYNSKGVSVEGENLIEINLSDYSKGIYMLQMISNGEQQMLRLVVE